MARTRAQDINGTPLCAHNHLLTPDNTYTVKGYKKCKTCHTEAVTRSRDKKLGRVESREERDARREAARQRFLAQNAAEIARLEARIAAKRAKLI